MSALAGKRILITRNRKKAGAFADLISTAGGIPIFFPTIDIKPVSDPGELDHALSRLSEYAWLVFTSTNTVDAVQQRMSALQIRSFPKSLKIAAVGKKTAVYLQTLRITPDIVPGRFVADEIPPLMGDLTGKSVLLPSADLATNVLPEAIRARGGSPHVITAYHTVPSRLEEAGLQALKDGVDILTFTSGSTIRNFIALVTSAGLDPYRLPGTPLVACIGPKTAHAARIAGLEPDIIASEFTVDGIVRAIQNQTTREANET
jgi:uroporphyrinogen-III synthase